MARNEFLPKCCPNCAATLRVMDTRVLPGRVVRQRVCTGCGYRCSTEERVREDQRQSGQPKMEPMT
jgi:transcriptional regulator NrdR family protein